MSRNWTVVDAMIPLHESDGDHQRDMKVPCGHDSTKQALQVETGFFPEPGTSAGPAANKCERDTEDPPLN